MTTHLKSFLQYLALNRNASAHTVRAYESDLTQFIGYVAAAADLKKRDLDPSQLDRAALRGFLGELHKQGADLVRLLLVKLTVGVCSAQQ